MTWDDVFAACAWLCALVRHPLFPEWAWRVAVLLILARCASALRRART